MVLDILQQVVFKELPDSDAAVACYDCVEVSEAATAIPNTSIRLGNVQRANKLSIINQLHLLVIPSEEPLHSSFLSEEVLAVDLFKWRVVDANTACSLKLLN